MSGDAQFALKSQQWFEKTLPCKKALLTPSCTHALEMAAILIDVKAGDEIIMPSYTFTSSANAFVLRGAKIIFVDIRPDTMNIDEKLIENAITKKTRAIVPVHYAGVACEMDTIMAIANKHKLIVIEDAAQAMMSSYGEKALGTIGHLGCYSFHDTKNYTSGGEGGLLIINDETFVHSAEITREKGTNRGEFFRGMIDKYSWVDKGSSYLMNDLSAAYLWGQIEKADEINKNRRKSWEQYYNCLADLADKGLIELPHIPDDCRHNAHMFYIKVADLELRGQLIKFLNDNDVKLAFHYIPLHQSVAGIKFGEFNNIDKYTTKESERLVRLPMFYGLQAQEISKVSSLIFEFFKVDA